MCMTFLFARISLKRMIISGIAGVNEISCMARLKLITPGSEGQILKPLVTRCLKNCNSLNSVEFQLEFCCNRNHCEK